MSTTTSVTFNSGVLSSRRPLKTIKNNNSRSIRAEVRTIAAGIAKSVADAGASNSEEFYQNHVTGIYMAIYAEVALAPLMGALAIHLYSRWIM
ncbi:hypothetical protein [Granulicella mallensis]|uniref:Uncharacterized protein n=1 Tax=Granulicella mallensis TaxID=940614 RepID=A0A7W8EA55_9BACT|nr:hypothetical protein [Granulicella mallensis]MBB5063050.1 hypothetical protein [Granulicella mallensis]